MVSTKGITVLLAGLLFLLIRRKWKHLFIFGSVALALCLPWILWQRSIPAPREPVIQYYSKASYSAGHIFGNCSLSQIADVLSTNVLWIAQGFVQIFEVSILSGPLISYILPAVLALLAAAGFWMTLRSRITAMHIWFIIYAGMLLCWIWPPERYQLPLLPLYCGYIGFAASALARNCPQRFRPRIAVGLATSACLLIAGISSFQIAQKARQRNSIGLTINGGPEDWEANKAIAEWIRNNTDSNAIIAANLDPLLYLLTERKAVRLFKADPYSLFYSPDKSPKPLGAVSDLRDHLLRQKVTYIAITPMDFYEEARFIMPLLHQLMGKYPRSLRLIKYESERQWQIWKVNRSQLMDNDGQS